MQTFQIHSSLIPSLRSGIINEPTFERTDKFENGYKFIFGNIVHETSIINWDRLKIGINNFFGPYTCIGCDPETLSQRSSGIIEIGDNNIFREHASVHLPTNSFHGTKIGNNNFFMKNVHVAHDCQIEDGIVMCNNVALAGYGYVMQGSILGLNSSVHQFQTIGSWSMIGMNCCVAKPNKIEPGYIYIGVPARKLNRNKIGLSRNKVTKEMLVAETHRYKKLMQRHLS